MRAEQSEKLFKHIANRAEHQGLQVNGKKMTLLAISGARSYQARAHIYDQNQERVDSVANLKTLGFIFNETGTVKDQIQTLIDKVNTRTWTLRELANGGFTEAERLEVYKTMIRPIIEYSSVVYNSMLTQEQEEDLEKVQTRALKNIYGHVYSRRQLYQMSGIETLKERRDRACLKFAQKLANNPRFACWLPRKRAGSRQQQTEEYVEYPARTDRRKNSPLFHFRRLLNTNRVQYDVRRMH